MGNCIQVYGPPASSGAGSTTLGRYRWCLEDGRIVKTYIQDDSLPCGCGTCCYGVWACDGLPLPESWQVLDKYLQKIITLNITACNNSDCQQQDGDEIYAVWTGQVTVNFPGNSQCAAFNNVIVNYYIGCFSAKIFNGAYNYALWVQCGWSGVLPLPLCAAQPGGFPYPNALCPGNSPPPINETGNLGINQWLPISLPCVQYPNSITISRSVHIPDGSFYGAPFSLHGLDCNTEMDASFVLTPSQYSIECGCYWFCNSLPVPTQFNITLSGNGITYGPFLIGGDASDGSCNFLQFLPNWNPQNCGWSGHLNVDVAATGSCPAGNAQIECCLYYLNGSANLQITMGFGANGPVMNSGCISSSAAVNYFGTGPPFIGTFGGYGIGLTVNPVSDCERPYSGSSSFDVGPITQLGVYPPFFFMLFGGDCPNGDPITINVTITEVVV